MRIIYNQKKIQLQDYSGRLKKMIDEGNFVMLSAGKKNILIRRIKKLQKQLLSLVPDFRRSKAFAFSSIVIGLCLGSANAQTFVLDGPTKNPFSLKDIGSESKPEFRDLDNDGDIDLLVGEENGALFYFENLGTATSPLFDTAVVNPFGLMSVDYYASPAIVDIDNDGDFDVFVGNYDGDLVYFQNVGSPNSPAFGTPQLNPFGFPGTGSDESKPEFGDLDNDGDLDLMVGEFGGKFYYFENIGSKSSPAFDTAAINPFGLPGVPYYSTPSFVDMDGDADLDLVSGESFGSFYYFENRGNISIPLFDTLVINPWGLSGIGDYSAPAFIDIDGDGDKDMFSGEETGDFYFFENIPYVGKDPLKELIGLSLYPNPGNGKVHLEVKALPLSRKVEISVMDGFGKRVYHSVRNNQQGAFLEELDLQHLKSGFYFVRFTADDRTQTRKLIIE